MSDGLLAFAFAAGIFAAVNPCGFAMLPAYLGYFLGLEGADADSRATVRRALLVALAVALGFTAVFGVLGILFQAFSIELFGQLPWVSIVIGVALAALGVAMLLGFEPMLSLPKLERGGQSQGLVSMFLFGVSYAIASVGCTLPLFLSAVITSFTRDSFAEGTLSFLAYAGGMALVLVTLTVSLALARRGIVARLRRVLPWMQRIAGGMLVLAGAYTAYYGWYELRVFRGEDGGGEVAGRAFSLNADLQNWLSDIGTTRIGVGLAIVLGGLIAWAWASSRHHGDQDASGPTGPGPDAAPTVGDASSRPTQDA